VYVCLSVYLSTKNSGTVGQLSPNFGVALWNPGDGLRCKKVGVGSLGYGAAIKNFMDCRPIGYTSTWLLVQLSVHYFCGRIFP